MTDREINGQEIGTVQLDGLPYRLVVHPPNCASGKHWHEEPHADGSPVMDAEGHLIAHHHHDVGCESQPRNATLYAAWDAEKRHEHRFDEPDNFDKCPCGAERERVPMTKSKTKREGRLFEYFMVSDADHPEGWSWQRWSKHD